MSIYFTSSVILNIRGLKIYLKIQMVVYWMQPFISSIQQQQHIYSISVHIYDDKFFIYTCKKCNETSSSPPPHTVTLPEAITTAPLAHGAIYTVY